MFRCSVIIVLLTFGFISIPQVDGTFHNQTKISILYQRHLKFQNLRSYTPIDSCFLFKISCVGGADYQQLQQLLNSPEVKQILSMTKPLLEPLLEQSLYILEKFEKFYSLLLYQDQGGEGSRTVAF